MARATRVRQRPMASAIGLALALAAAAPQELSAARVQKFELDVPRVTTEELEANNTLRRGHHAYVIKDYFQDRWKAANWTLDYLLERIPFEWVDFYPENMRDLSKKPFLIKVKEAMPKYQQKSPHSRYMQIRIGLKGWQRLVKDFDPLPVPDVFWSDEEWIQDCMRLPSGKPDKKAINNFYVTQQWKFLLIGEKDTTMFFHKDGLASSSWQAQIAGRKMWTLCPNTESHLLSEGIDTYNPDYKRFPRFADAKCGQVTAAPGDLLYYPSYWWHHAYQLDTPTISYTGLLVGVEDDRDDVGGDRRVHRAMYSDLVKKCKKCWTKGRPDRHCDDISLQWPGAAPPPMRAWCDDYLPKCLEAWDDHARNLFKAPPATPGAAVRFGEAPDYTWAWGDLSPGASRNPMRWSAYLTRYDMARDLLEHGRPSPKRPVRIQSRDGGGDWRYASTAAAHDGLLAEGSAGDEAAPEAVAAAATASASSPASRPASVPASAPVSASPAQPAAKRGEAMQQDLEEDYLAFGEEEL